MEKKKIRVLVVEDSMLFRKMLIDRLSELDNIEVVGYAIDAFDAEQKILKLTPDVVTLDVELPKMSGIEFLKKFLPTYSVPVVMVSALNISVFDALSSGAVDFVRKPGMTENNIDNFIRDLSTKIYIASMARVRTKLQTQPTAPTALGQNGAAPRVTGSTVPPPAARAPIQTKPIPPIGTVKDSALNNSMIIALGASTGGTEATLAVLKDLPANIPPIVVVQHMPAGFTDMYAQRLNRLCNMNVKEAKTGDKLTKGNVYVAPGDFQLKVQKIGSDFVIKCFEAEKVSGHRPSVDVMFESVAECAGSNAVGIIMTGMGQDGAKGLLSMRKKGAYTIGQDKDSCVVYGMPMVAFNIGGVTTQAACEDISRVLLKHLNTR
ncbi:MAG: chemotaxis response regulator protein-glutamate methylesterase [Oscillospiraceae bacterium]